MELTKQTLTAVEQTRLAECEAIVERGIKTFVEVGTALAEIRDSRLYRQTHRNFTDYCSERWGMHRSRAYQLIDAAAVTAELSTVVDNPPTTERQARELAAVPAEERAEVWQEAVETAPKADDGTPKVTAAHVRETARARQPESAANPEPADESPDLVKELELADKRIRQLEAEIASLRADDVGREIRSLHARLAQTEANHQDALRTLSKVREQVNYAEGVLRKVRRELGVERDRDILPAIRERIAA